MAAFIAAHGTKLVADAEGAVDLPVVHNHRFVTARKADKSGLLEIDASVRGLLLVRPDTFAVLERIVASDLSSVLCGEGNEAEAAMRADLIVRVAALLQFYGSEEYLKLRRALTDG